MENSEMMRMPLGERMSGILDFLSGGAMSADQPPLAMPAQAMPQSGQVTRSQFTPNREFTPEEIAGFDTIANQPAMAEPQAPMTAFDEYQMAGIMGQPSMNQMAMQQSPMDDIGGPDDPVQTANILRQGFGFNSLQEAGAEAIREAETGEGRGVLNVLKGFLGNQETMANLAIAFNSMRLTPDPSLAAAMQSRVERIQEQGALSGEINATANWLTSRGYDDLAQLVIDSPSSMKSVMEIVFKGMSPEEALTPKDNMTLATTLRSNLITETKEDTDRVRSWRVAIDSLRGGNLSDFQVTTALVNWLNAMGAPARMAANGDLETESGIYSEFARKFNEARGQGQLTADQIGALTDTLNIAIEPVIMRLGAAETYYGERFGELGREFDSTTIYGGLPFDVMEGRAVFRLSGSAAKADADYDKLKSGDLFMDLDGQIKRKP
jgi:hypothetical protein